MVSTSRILVAVVKMCYEAKEWDLLNENIMLLSKRRSQLKQVSAQDDRTWLVLPCSLFLLL